LESSGKLNSSLVECVPNFSEGHDPAKIDALVRAISAVDGTILLDRTSDVDHNRTVITYAGTTKAVLESALAAVAKALELIDLRSHRGVHPRVGALDVLPFVPLGGTTMDDCVALAHEAGERIWRELSIPVYFYEAAAKRPDRVRLENARRGQFEGLLEAALIDEKRRPDVGGPALHPTAGAVLVGARKLLIAFNINLATRDLSLAKSIAKAIRTSGGGFPAVKALGLPLTSRGLVQVSLNLTDFERTPLDVVFSEVKRLAQEQGVAIAESELIGLMPQKALELAAAGFLKLQDFSPQQVLERRIAAQIP
jgi:glutamate formiminotransferase/glutamate formiminotransferase/formiminotetrahydrofolate cyclodeaminase